MPVRKGWGRYAGRGLIPVSDQASGCDFDVDIAYNSITIDAKSIVGVLGLDFRHPMSVVCHGYDESFDRYLKDRTEEKKE